MKQKIEIEVDVPDDMEIKCQGSRNDLRPVFTPDECTSQILLNVFLRRRMDSDFDKETTEANARLIAASPDLLAACEFALECLVDWDRENGEAGDMLRTAIAKAKGTP